MSHIDLAPNAHRPDQDAINDVGRELYETFMQPSDPEWDAEDDDVRADYVAHAIRLIDTYIASAPKAWARKRGGRVDPGYVSTDVDRLRVHLEEFCADDGIEIVRVALVEIPEENLDAAQPKAPEEK